MEILVDPGSTRYAKEIRYKCSLLNGDGTCGSSCPANGAVESVRGKGKHKYTVFVCEQPRIGALAAFSCDRFNPISFTIEGNVRI